MIFTIGVRISSYDIMNYRPIEKTANGTVYGYRRIGGWDNGQLTMDDDVFWPGNARGYTYARGSIESVCSKPCPFGEIKVYIQRTGFTFVPCLNNVRSQLVVALHRHFGSKSFGKRCLSNENYAK